MRRLFSIAVIMLMWTGQALALAPTNELLLQDAHAYGRKFALESYTTFMRPWTAVEEKAAVIDSSAEHAHIFTPFSLVAATARQSILMNKEPLVEDSKKILAQYNGYLVFSINLQTSKPINFNKILILLKQDEQEIPVYHLVEGSFDASHKRTQFYIYFEDKHIKLDHPILLTVKESGKKGRTFFFDLSKIK